MLEIRNLSKTYKSKHNVVHALDHINLKLQDKGMVFILGKSGSGKSTLLNVLGGLDQFDDGEIIICGKSSKAFKQSDFDSYRNTFIGFIFQEYNVMENFTVKENIALALQLQGKKASDQKIESILKEVDLQGLQERMPNELSGGQLQRVAIARALIKSPEIIMADEPTGALDSRTGKQVFDTLKKLSQKKLVLVVSHDRDFAKRYGDRIIELADGKIISDTTKECIVQENASQQMQIIEDAFINIKSGKKLSPEELQVITQKIMEHDQDVFISFDQKTNEEMKQNHDIDENGAIALFEPTNFDNIDTKQDREIAFIRSKLPFSSSLKLSLSNLKCKPFRLFMTIFLSVCAFTAFGMATTLSQYQKEEATYQSMKDAKVDYISISKQERVYYDDENYYYQNAKLTTKDFEVLQKQFPDLSFQQVFSGNNDLTSLDLSSYLPEENKETKNPWYPFQTLNGLSTIDADQIQTNQMSYIGNLPTKENDILLSNFLIDAFIKQGYQTVDAQGNIVVEKITKAEDMLGKELTLFINGKKTTFQICGILDTKLDLSRYQSLVDGENTGITSMYLQTELNTITNYSHHTLGFVSPAVLQQILDNYMRYDLAFSQGYVQLNLGESSYSLTYAEPLSLLPKEKIVTLQETGNFYVPYETMRDILVDENITLGNYVDMQLSEHPDQDRNALIKDAISKYKQEILQANIAVARYDYDGNTVSLGDFAGVYVADLEEEYLPTSIAFTDDAIASLQLKKSGSMDYTISMNKSDVTSKDVIRYTYESEGQDAWYLLQNQVMPMITTANSVIEVLEPILLFLGFAFAIFASLMFCNFIATSITNKKREIGILRAVGARGIDVLKIFLNESLIIAGINWILAVVLCIAGAMFMNHFLQREFLMNITIINFGILQVLQVLLISVAVAFIGSAIPVYRISAKKPIDAIKNRK